MGSTTPDTTDLRAAVEATLRAEIADIVQRTASEHLYALALGFVDDITGFFLAGTTREWAADLCSRKRRADVPSYLWYPSEWPVEARPKRAPKPSVSHVLSALTDAVNDDEVAYEAFRRAYENLTVEVLQQLRTEGVLRAPDGTELLVWLHYADAFDEDIDDRTFPLLNAQELATAFARRWDANAPINTELETLAA